MKQTSVEAFRKKNICASRDLNVLLYEDKMTKLYAKVTRSPTATDAWSL
jgi:hypothetical protein